VTEARHIVIVGSGPAGLTAAIYSARAQLFPLVIEGEPSSTSDQPGGQLMLTTEVENYPGFVQGIMGPELMGAFREQAARFGTDFVTAKVSRVDLASRPFGLWVGDPDADEPTYSAEAVIVATGAKALMLDLPNEERLLGYGVSTCATCDGFFRGKDIAVVGGGDSALEEALFLTRFADKVTLIHRRGELRASKVMQQRALDNPKIEFLWHTSVIDVLGETTVSGVRLRNNESGAESELALSGLFVAIGHQPNTELFKGQLDMEDNGYLKTLGTTSYTNVEGVFACGDVQDHRYRQAITAAGSGCMAAIDAERWIEDQAAGRH